MKPLIWYYDWDEQNYCNGSVIGFLSRKCAREHALKNHPNVDIEVSCFEFNGKDLLDMYTGE